MHGIGAGSAKNWADDAHLESSKHVGRWKSWQANPAPWQPLPANPPPMEGVWRVDDPQRVEGWRQPIVLDPEPAGLQQQPGNEPVGLQQQPGNEPPGLQQQPPQPPGLQQQPGNEPTIASDTSGLTEAIEELNQFLGYQTDPGCEPPEPELPAGHDEPEEVAEDNSPLGQQTTGSDGLSEV